MRKKNLLFFFISLFSLQLSFGRVSDEVLTVTKKNIFCDNLNVSSSTTNVCLGDSVTLTATSSNGGSISWSGGISNGVPFFPTTPGTYTYTATSSNLNDCTGSISIIVWSKFGPFCDYDNDGIANNIDIDDDNDGVLDIDECTNLQSKKIALIIDESGSISGDEITQIKSGLISFINNQIGSGNIISFIGMSSSDTNTRTDHIQNVFFSLDGVDSTPSFDNWIAGYRGGRVSNSSDYWASGFDFVVNNLNLGSGDEVIVITDGAQGLKSTSEGYANILENLGVHLFVIGVDTNGYFGISNVNVNTAVNGIFDNVAGSSGNPIQEVTNYFLDYETSEYDRVISFTALGNSLTALSNFLAISCDLDGDKIVNSFDLDSDNDGISDLIESSANYNSLDPDNNGIIDNIEFIDINNNGLADAIENINGQNIGTQLADNDGDLINNIIDLDSDGDGIPDAVEAQLTLNYNVFFNYATCCSDPDEDGVLTIFDSFSGYGGSFLIPQDTDNDGNFDYIDLDSDDDSLLDSIESGLTISGSDIDGDGIDDNSSIGASYLDPNGMINNPSSYLDNQIGNTTEVAYREVCKTEAQIGIPIKGKNVVFSTLNTQGNSDWLDNISNGILILGSKTKGLVLTRMVSPETSILNPVEGMLVFDADENVLKLYNGNKWVILTRKCN